MADMMTFPKTVEEYMEQYKITDTEQIYTNGIELVPIFRMRQWFEHKPEPKTGMWNICYDEDAPQDGVWLCSVCGYVRLIDDISPQNFCPNCGARMVNGGNEK